MMKMCHQITGRRAAVSALADAKITRAGLHDRASRVSQGMFGPVRVGGHS